MIFDKMARAIESSGDSDLLYLAKEARLFHFPDDPLTKKEYTEEQAAWLRENFVLPFPVTAVEDRASCVIISGGEGDVGICGRLRTFVEYLPPNRDSSMFTATPEWMRGIIPDGIGTLLIAKMRVESIDSERTRMACAGGAAWATDAKDRVITPSIPQDGEESSCGASNWQYALLQLAGLNGPNRFILEAEPVGAPKHIPPIPRSHQRPIYTLLKPGEIRARLGIAEPAGCPSPRPHERRAHTRTFRSSFFTRMRGKTVVIPATWVGPSEKRVKNHYYRVLLDR